MKQSQQDSGPSGWPYRVQMKSALSTGWSAILFREQVAIAKVTGFPKAGEVQDLRFDHPEREAAFLTWLNGVRLPKGVDRTAESVVHFLMLQATTTGNAECERSPTLEEVAAEMVTLFGFPLNQNTSLSSSSSKPLPLHTACSQAMRVHNVSEGDEVQLFETYGNASFELAELGVMLLSDNPTRFTPEASENTVKHLVALLAALGVACEHTATGRMRKDEQERLKEMVDAQFGVEATVLHLMDDDSCPHEVLLRAICLHAPRMEAYLAYDQDEQDDLLELAVAFIRALTAICDMDVNSVLSYHLNQSKKYTGTKARPALKP
ncbi:hypothetical protein Q0M94_25330 (plasmid) [Deinococcus radiomollis]|uniref:hypothetical protein n=1 Tax=Deinococcus radiomollis TaxID=468916 RepID=UPI003891796B